LLPPEPPFFERHPAMSAVPRKGWFVVMAVWALIVVAIAMGLGAWAKLEGVNAVRARLESAAPWLLLWRLTLGSLLMLGWGPLSASVSRYFDLSARSEQALRD
jgi:hypothetical protein